MKPVNINLTATRGIRNRRVKALVAVLVVAACAVTVLNVYDYIANSRVIDTYEMRMAQISARARENRMPKTPDTDSAKRAETLAFFSPIVKKAVFPLPQILTELERIKPETLDIDAVVFAQNLDTVRISGRSHDVDAVSRFIVDLDRSPVFTVHLSRQEILENRQIAFELTLMQAGDSNGPKI